MSKTERPLQALADYLPPEAFLPVTKYLQQYKVHLTVTRERKSILGNYRNAYNNQNHRISVNGTLNMWSFLVTLLHEIAHLLTYEKWGNKVQPHGKEWKALFGQLLAQFITNKIFPEDIEKELVATLHNPGASSCADENLMRVLRRYDKKKEGQMLVEEIPLHALFEMKDGTIFKKGERLRKRYRCEEVKTRKIYLFNPLFEVKLLSSA